MTVPLVKDAGAGVGVALLSSDQDCYFDLSPSLRHRAERSGNRRRLLKLSYGRWLAHDNHASERCLYLATEIHMKWLQVAARGFTLKPGPCALPDACNQ